MEKRRKSKVVTPELNYSEEIQNLLHSPYTNQEVSATVIIEPSLLNNDFDLNLKQKIIKIFEGKCYDKYGFIQKVYKITNYENGFIEQENQLCAPKFHVNFYCKLCMPINKREIICKISVTTEGLIIGINGPIQCIIQTTDINADNFYVGYDVHLRDRKTNNIVKKDDYVKVFINSVNFRNNDDRINDYNVIVTVTKLMSMASQHEIELFEQENS